jgi:hypothetical protein
MAKEIKEIKFTDEEVSTIGQLRTDASNIFTQLGQLAIEKDRRIKEIEDIHTSLINKHQALQQTEQELFQTLNKKYGDGNYDPKTNTFVPVVEENEEKESKEEKK